MGEKDEQAIREVIQTWLAATKTHHAETVLGLMTDDAVFLTAGNAPFGKAELAKAMESQKGMTIDGQSEIRHIEVSGDLAFAHCELAIHVTMPDGKSMRRAGPVLSVFRRGPDARWRLARDANFLR